MSAFKLNADQSARRDTRTSGRYGSKRALGKKLTSDRKKKLIVKLSLILILVVVFLLIICLPKKDLSIVGTWQYNEYTQYEFYEDGKGCLNVDDVRYEYVYKATGRTLKVDFTQNIVRDCEYSYSISGSTLTLIGGEGTDGGTYTLTKLS